KAVVAAVPVGRLHPGCSRSPARVSYQGVLPRPRHKSWPKPRLFKFSTASTVAELKMRRVASELEIPRQAQCCVACGRIPPDSTPLGELEAQARGGDSSDRHQLPDSLPPPPQSPPPPLHRKCGRRPLPQPPALRPQLPEPPMQPQPPVPENIEPSPLIELPQPDSDAAPQPPLRARVMCLTVTCGRPDHPWRCAPPASLLQSCPSRSWPAGPWCCRRTILAEPTASGRLG
uniref:Rhoa gtpase effector dia/diaphanous n=1 Tax=Macrostomum lignano TaxID=282301 RepID=A0A1I8F5F0_9PLAT